MTIRDPKKCAIERRKLLALIQHCERETGGVIPTRVNIGKAIGATRSVVQNHLCFLKERRMIELVYKDPKRGGGGSKYRVIDNSLLNAA